MCNVHRVRLYVSTPITSRPQIKVAACQISPPAPASQEYSSSRIDSQRIYKCGTSPTATSKGTISFCWNTDLLDQFEKTHRHKTTTPTMLWDILRIFTQFWVAWRRDWNCSHQWKRKVTPYSSFAASAGRVARDKRLLSRVYLFVCPGSKEISFDKRWLLSTRRESRSFYMNDVISLGRNSSVD